MYHVEPWPMKGLIGPGCPYFYYLSTIQLLFDDDWFPSLECKIVLSLFDRSRNPATLPRRSDPCPTTDHDL